MPLSRIVEAIEYGMSFKLFEIDKTAITLSSLIMFFAVIGVFALVSKLLLRVPQHKYFPG